MPTRDKHRKILGDLPPTTPARRAPEPSAADLIAAAIAGADRKRGGFGGFFRDDGDGETFVPMPAMARANAGDVVHISLRAGLPEIAAVLGDAAPVPTPPATPAAETRTVETEILARSRVLQAGAHLVHVPTLPADVRNGVPILTDTPSGLVRIAPAGFSKVADDAEVGASSSPVSVATVDRDTAPGYAVRFEITRAATKARGPDRVLAEIVASIGMGVARLVDLELLTALVATTPPAFSMAAAAGSGVTFPELRALVGTDGTGAAADRGGLYVSGVPGELTDTVAATVVGSFARVGVAVLDELTVAVDRRDRSGKIALTAWVNCQALLADPAPFWLAA